MTDPSFDRRFTAWLDERAQPHAPTGLTADIVERTARSRPRPAWRVPERWFTMPTSIRLALIPRGLLLTFLALWALLALTVAGAVVGGRLTSTRAASVPAPVNGPAANGLVAFERDSDIHVVEPDGSGERPLIAGPGLEGGPSWSPDGTRIAYTSSATEEAPGDVIVANADGTNAVTIATALGIDAVSWSPDGTRIAVSSSTAGAPTEISVANADGTDAVTIATVPALGAIEWSPDGATLLLSGIDSTRLAPCSQVAASEGYCGRRLFTAATDGSSGAVAIGDPELDVRDAYWSPDGTTIAFGGSDASTIRLYAMAPDGTDVRPISTSSGRGWSFMTHSWSPEGTQIVTQVEKPDGSGHDIILVAADGSGDTIVTDTPIDRTVPTFAVDGSIAWWAHPAEEPDPCCIEVLGADGVLSVLPGIGWPSFSPDGQYVITTPSDEDLAALGSEESLYIVERDGTIAATLHTGGLDWQRLAPAGS